ncbi:curli assembly protein CsgF [Xanthovirga aplysinae]|uniref:curli assembly protein CsgF n=1 Tax=Xanthovirga aplysinae TaxID=2529853 RepID=UPI0012BBF5AB|nr:curli assembly protein CsgF [Xanthovirga aplysinae]MTI30730.1 curli production assembly/transport component CsgF [Xanthovirga aplysinae]
MKPLTSKIFQLLFCISFVLVGAHSAKGQDFVYKPTNPAFGGDSYNGSWLLQMAQAQKEEEDPPDFEQDPLEDFEKDIQRQILDRIGRDLLDDYFEDGLEEGITEVGGYRIETTSDVYGLNVTIYDLANGNEANIVIPTF